MSAAELEAAFQASHIELLIPYASEVPESEYEDERLSSEWWDGVEQGPSRDVAFYDEKLVYYVGMSLDPDFAPGTTGEGDDTPPQLRALLPRLHLTTTASFIPTTIAPPSFAAQAVSTPTPNNSLAPPQSFAAQQALPPSLSLSGGGSSTPANFSHPPVTPLPQPLTKSGDEHYAGIEGQVLWEGEVLDGRKVIRRRGVGGGWLVVWKGEVPIAYVRTQIRDPMLAITASITLREPGGNHGAGHKKAAFSVDTISLKTLTLDNHDEVVRDDEYDEAEMEEIDLLGGLASDAGLTTARLGQSIRQDLSLSSAGDDDSATTNSPVGRVSHSHNPSRSLANPLQAITTLRKSYRRVLSLSPGLRVRMRTVFLPQLLTPQQSEDDVHDSEGDGGEGGDGEKKIVLCVEVENPLNDGSATAPAAAFEISDVKVEISGKGGDATAELVCQPEQLRLSSGDVRGQEDSGSGSLSVFPLRLQAVEQYNLLYAVTIASAPGEARGSGSEGVDEAVMRNMGRGDQERPAAITVFGRPFFFSSNDSAPGPGDNLLYPTATFSSRWNCTLDLKAYYDSIVAQSVIPPPNKTQSRGQWPVRHSNPIAGDKRYSLSTLLSDSSSGRPDPRRLPVQKPLLPSQAMNLPATASAVAAAAATASTSSDGLLVSVKLLPQAAVPGAGADAGTSSSRGVIRPFEPFSIEVFVHNRTERIRRFRLSIPPREPAPIPLPVLGLDRERLGLKKQISARKAAATTAANPPLLPLENDIRCGPLLPGGSLSARMRFLALREGVHKVEKLRVTGVGDDWDFIMSPVLDVIVEA